MKYCFQVGFSMNGILSMPICLIHPDSIPVHSPYSTTFLTYIHFVVSASCSHFLLLCWLFVSPVCLLFLAILYINHCLVSLVMYSMYKGVLMRGGFYSCANTVPDVEGFFFFWFWFCPFFCLGKCITLQSFCLHLSVF